MKHQMTPGLRRILNRLMLGDTLVETFPRNGNCQYAIDDQIIGLSWQRVEEWEDTGVIKSIGAEWSDGGDFLCRAYIITDAGCELLAARPAGETGGER